MSTALTATEAREFSALEADIEPHIDGFVKAGNALAKIRDKRLYRDSHGSFDAYCRARWNLGKSRAYQLISSAEIAEQVSAIVDDQPKRESHVRPLAKLPEEQREPAWREAVETAPDGVTAEHVEAIVDARLNLSDQLELDGDPLVFTCQVCGGTELTTDEDGTFCAKCKDPIDAAPAKPQPAKPKSTIVDRCQAFWDSLTQTERIIAAGWFQDQLG